MNPFAMNFPTQRTNLGKSNQVPYNILLCREDLLSLTRFLPGNFTGTGYYVGVVNYLVCYLMSGTARAMKMNVSEMSLFDWCMIFLLCCLTTCVHISTCVVS